jgi:serine phosphatase RsbU (regulator of sigma subunit)
MANTRSLLRSTAYQLITPASVLRKVNELLISELPESMFVTCFYAVIDPSSGKITFANAGHNPPYMTNHGSVDELCARGMPFGWMPDRIYEEIEMTLEPGESILLYSDGLVEAHDEAYEMFGNPRVESLLCTIENKLQIVDILVSEYSKFTGTRWEQEDDITLMAIHHLGRTQDITSWRGMIFHRQPVWRGWEISRVQYFQSTPSRASSRKGVLQAIEGLGLSSHRSHSLRQRLPRRR